MRTHCIPFAALAVSAVIVMGAVRASAQDYTPTEIKGTQLSTEWQERGGVVTRGPDGKVVFLFGEVQPSVVCSPLQVCDIELEPGEIVRDVLVGDTVRWKVEPAVAWQLIMRMACKRFQRVNRALYLRMCS